MATVKPMQRRLYGYLCVLILLQEFHPVILAESIKSKQLARAKADQNARNEKVNVKAKLSAKSNTETQTDSSTNKTRHTREVEKSVYKVHHQIKRLSEKLQLLQSDFVLKANEYIQNCSDDHMEDIADFGGKTNPNGVITMVMMALLYILVDCGHKANDILEDITEEVGDDTVVELLNTIDEMIEDVQNETHTDTSEKENTDDPDDDQPATDDENAFLSDLLAENILNTYEMNRLFDVLVKGEQFENSTDVETLISELDEFSLEELIDRPNYKWITFPSASNANLSALNGSGIKHVIESLNSNSTKRLIREMSVSIKLDSKTSMLVIYEKQSNNLLSVTDDGKLSLTPYDQTLLQNHLWVLDDGQLINVGFHLALYVDANETSSAPLVLEHTRNVSKWRNCRGRLLYGNTCFLVTGSPSFKNSTSSQVPSVSVNCNVDIQDVNVFVVAFKDVNTPEKLTMHIEQPESCLGTIVSKIANSKFMLFVYLLVYFIRSLIPGYKSKSNPMSKPEMIKLDDTFFIKNSGKLCEVLSSRQSSYGYDIVFEEFSEDTMEFQLWYWKDNQIVNVGTHASLVTNNVTFDEHDHDVINSRFFRLWVLDNGRITALNNRSCELKINDDSNSINVHCGSDYSSSISQQNWTFITFDKPNFNNFVEVVCMFFIQSTLWPCELVTGTENELEPLLSPMLENMFTQLWYMSNGRLVNVDNGRALTENESTGVLEFGKLDVSNITLWYLQSDQILNKDEEQLTITLNGDRNGTLYTTNNNRLTTQLWNIVTTRHAQENIEALSCKDTAIDDMEPFVIRNKNIPACQLLTMIDENNTTTLHMKHFDESRLDDHLWVMYRGNLINIAFGLSIQPVISESQGEKIDIQLGTLHAFEEKQKWWIDDSGTIRWKLHHECFIDLDGQYFGLNSKLFLNCDTSKSFRATWSITKLPANEQDLTYTLTYMCFYFIRSKDEPCQFVTANPIDGSVHLRPLVPNLLEKQLWCWNDHFLSMATTGQFLNSSGVMAKDTTRLTLTNPESENLTPWKFTNGRHLSTSEGETLSVDTNGGVLFISTDDALALDLLFVNYDTYLQEDEEISCSVPVNEETSFFFIRSHQSDCLVLTGTEPGKMPIFRHFEQDNIESQLWFYVNNHIVNLKSQLVLHVDVKSRIGGSRVVMQNYYKYATEQMWEFRDNMVVYKSFNCVLDIDVSSGDILVWCHVHGGYNQRWDLIDFGDEAEYIDELTCMFFVRHEVVPCELLTCVGNSVVQLRPVSEEFFNNQIWYWSGDHILSAETGLALDISSGQIVMQNKVKDKTSQQWTRKSNFIISQTLGSSVIGLDSKTGTVKLLRHDSNQNSETMMWTLIDLSEGLNDISLLNCENALSNPNVYFIKSEKDPCYVLSEHGDGAISLKKAGDKGFNQAWVKVRRHIVNGVSGKSLNVDIISDGEHVNTRTRFEHEVGQHWQHAGSAVQITSSGRTKLLDAYDDVCVWSKDDSDGQKWAWHNAKDVEKETKLLRCSKCFNRMEEKANAVMQYIPIIGSLYSLIRAPVYAGKGCSDVAKESLIDIGMGIAFDIVIGGVTVLTAGTASAAAYGIKTASQFGVRAGIKAAIKATTTSIKLALRQATNAGRVMLKQGLKKTIVSLSKKGLTSIKYTFKSNLKVIKQLPSVTKSVVVKTGQTLKRVPTKIYNTIRSTSYGSFKTSVKSGLRKLPSKLKNKLNQIGDKLAKKAESKIRRLDDLKRNKPTTHIRCKRSGTCKVPKKKGTPKIDKNVPNTSAFIPKPSKDVLDNFDRLLKRAREDVNLDGLQNSHFGLSYKPLHKKTDAILDTDTVESMVLRDVDEYPFDKYYNRKKNTMGNKKPQSHTEQALFPKVVDKIRKTCGGKNCELYMWTKNNPCMKNTYKLVSGEILNAKSCFAMMIETCYDLVKNQKGFKMCHIGFMDFYGLQGKSANLQKEFMDELKTFKATQSVLHPNSARKITEAAANNMQDFIRFYQIPA